MTTRQTTSTIYFAVMNMVAPGAVVDLAIPNDNTLFLGATDANHVFVFPDDCTLARCCLHGSASAKSTNNLFGPGPDFPQVPIEVDVFVDGEFVQELFILPAGTTSATLFANPNLPIKAGSEVQFVVPLTADVTGTLTNFTFSFEVGPT